MTIKKAELHTHLEGTIRPGLAKKLAARNKLSFPENRLTEDGQSYVYRDFMEFLNTYDLIAGLIRKPEDYYDITFDYLQENAAANAIYTEMMYSPDHAEKTSNIPSSEHLQAIQQAIDDAEKKFNIIGRIIITGVRHFGVDAVTAVAKQSLKETVPCIVGFGLGGDEINYPPQLFINAYQIAAAGGLACTIHAAEFAPASTIVEAINSLPIKRIGHGVQAILAPEVIKHLQDHDIALELCPSSNICLNVFKNLPSHPFPKFMAAGVKISLNTDDPPFFRTNLAAEYQKVQQAYLYTDQQMEMITTMAIDVAFVDQPTKLKLKKRLGSIES